MTQPRSAEAVPSGASAAQRTADPPRAQRTARPPLAPQERRVVYRLIALVAVPAVLALTLTGLWVTGAARSAETYGQAGRLATLGQQVTGLAQAMADERSGTATFISAGRPAAGLSALRRQYAITDAWAARVRRLASQLGSGYPAQARADAAEALASIGKLPGLRRQAAQSQASPLAVITGYSAAASGLFPVDDGIADLSGNPVLTTSALALGALSRMADHASQQRAILGVALAQGRLGPGALTALTTAQAQQASDLASFRDSATPAESRALTETLADAPARQAQAVEQRAIAGADGALALGPQASQQWSAGMSYTAGWMGHADQELAAWITADAQALRQNAMRSALITGGAGLGALALLLVGALFAARSLVRWRRRLEAAAVHGAAGPPPASAGAPPANLAKMDHLATQIWRNSDSALILADRETQRPAEPLALVEVLETAASEMEQSGRVVLDVQHDVCVSGCAATDTVHLLAELLENATTFSPETAPVIVSGHALYGGGSLITISDGGPGVSEEELTQLNWQLANPSLTDMAAARHMGLFAVALLAERHGITVTLSTPPDGGTTAEVYLPDALTSLDADPDRWRAPAGEASPAEESTQADAGAADLPFFARRSASDPAPAPGPESDAPEAVPVMLGAPVPSPAPGTAVTEPGPVDAEPGDGPPIFASVRSGYLYAFGRDPLPFGEEQTGQPPPGQPAGPPASEGDESGRTRAGASETTVAPPSARESSDGHQRLTSSSRSFVSRT